MIKVQLSKYAIDIICRSLLAIVSVLRQDAELPEYKNIIITISERDSVTTPPFYETQK